jgi:hypothetical protein
VQKRAEAEIYQRECAAWQPYFEQAIEYPASCIFVALKGGKLGATGRLLPGRNMGEAHECLEREDKDVFDFSVEEIPASFWSLSGMDFKSSAAGNGLNYYCHVGCRTADVLSLFPGERMAFVTAAAASPGAWAARAEAAGTLQHSFGAEVLLSNQARRRHQCQGDGQRLARRIDREAQGRVTQARADY